MVALERGERDIQKCMHHLTDIFICVKCRVKQAIQSHNKATPIHKKLSVPLKTGSHYHRKQIKTDSLFLSQTLQPNF